MINTLFLYVSVLLISVIPLVISSCNEKIRTLKSNLWRGNSLPIIALVTIYTLFWGLRENVGADFIGYIRYYNNTPEYVEYGFQFLCNFLKSFGFTHVALFLTTSFFTIFLLLISCRNYTSRILGYAVYYFFCSTFVFFAQNGIRQSLAVSLVLLALSVDSKKYIVSFLIFVFAFLFHKTAIIAFAAFYLVRFLPRIHIKSSILLIIYLVSVFLGELVVPFLMPKLHAIVELGGVNYERYYEDFTDYANKAQIGSGLGVILKHILVSLIIFSQDNFLTRKKDFIYYTYCFFLGGAILAPILEVNVLLKRFNLYFYYLSFIPLAAYTAYAFHQNKNKLHFICACFFLVSYFLLFVMAIFSNSNRCVPYNSILNL